MSERAAAVKVFRCGSARNAAHLRDHGPRWQTSQGGSRGRSGSGYGESVQTVGATAASGVRLKERVVPETGTNALDEPGNAERFGV